MGKLNIIAGDKYNKLTVICEGDRIRLPSGQTNRTMFCRCDCGNTKTVRVAHLTRGRVSSCGCIKNTLNGEGATNIGRLFSGMKSRCAPYHSESHLYYDKGINVCDEWVNNYLSFKSWCLVNGYKYGLHIDRIDGNKGYNPDNCRFVTPKQNANNRFNTVYVWYNGCKISLSEFIDITKTKISRATLIRRINKGLRVGDILKTPIIGRPKKEISKKD